MKSKKSLARYVAEIFLESWISPALKCRWLHPVALGLMRVTSPWGLLFDPDWEQMSTVIFAFILPLGSALNATTCGILQD